jgi:hypothetical protein
VKSSCHHLRWYAPSRELEMGGVRGIPALARMTMGENTRFFVIPAKAGIQRVAVGVFFNVLLGGRQSGDKLEVAR